MSIANQQNNPYMFVGLLDERQINYIFAIYLPRYNYSSLLFISCILLLDMKSVTQLSFRLYR